MPAPFSDKVEATIASIFPAVHDLDNHELLDYAEVIGGYTNSILQSIAASLIIIARGVIKYLEANECQMPEHKSLGSHYH